MSEHGENFSDRLVGLGDKADELNVRLSTQLIHLLSDQLYSSPLKAIEELVVNSYDADAKECRVAISSDSVGEEDAAFIAVFDDGIGMNIAGLHDLWHIGASRKLTDGESPSLHRKLIGKFGIGKLATYAIANQITYISRQAEEIFYVTCDYRRFKSAPEGGTPEAVQLVVNRVKSLTDLRDEAMFARVCKSLGVSPKDLTNGKYATWTICLLETLKPKAADLKIGRLEWVISTALPLKTDFKVYVNSAEILSSKEKIKAVVSFAPGHLSAARIKDLNDKWGMDWRAEEEILVSSEFPAGISGTVLVAERSLLAGKSADLGRSHGFFVRVRDRLLNESDPLFGKNPLSHATFNYFRADLNIDDLNDEVTASREMIEAGRKRKIVEDLLAQIFNEARSRQIDAERAEQDKEDRKRDGERSYVAPRLVEHPIAGVLATDPVNPGSDADNQWFYIQEQDQALLTQTIEKLYQPRSGYRYEYVSLGRSARMVRLDPATSTFTLNDDHPLVRANQSDGKARILLEHLATAEVMLEVYMRDADIPPAILGEILERRNTLLSSLAMDQVYSLKEIADNLRGSSDDQYNLEVNIVAAARALGLNAKHISGAGEPDGLARFNNFSKGERKITLEAKSSKDVPQLPHFDFATLNRHAVDYEAEGCMLVAPAYPGFSDDTAAVPTNAKQQRVSCWLVEDLARVVENAERLQISAADILEIVCNNFTPASVQAAINALLDRNDMTALYQDVMGALRDVFNSDFLSEGEDRTIDQVATVINLKRGKLPKKDVKNALIDMSAASQGLLLVNGESVLLLGDLEELERRIGPATGLLGAPRKAGTFRAVSEP